MATKRNRRGIALAWTAIMLFVMIGIVGLSIDWGKAVYNAHQLQNAADAAALAGAQWVAADQGKARDRAVELALANRTEGIPVQIDRNDANADTGDLVLGRWAKNTRTFTATLAKPNAVRVVARRTRGSTDGPVAMIFGHLAGTPTVNITRQAIAINLSSAGAGIIALAPDGVGLEFKGTPGRVICEGGAVQVDSESRTACSANGTPGREALICDAVNVCGDPGADSTFASFDGIEIHSDASYVPDPLEDAPRPGTADGTPGPEVYDTSLTQQGNELWPGYYPDGLSFNNGTHILHPGVYILDNGLKITGGTIDAQYCQIYVRSGELRYTGNGTLNISPPGDNPANWVDGAPVADGALGVSIWQADENTTEAKMAGTGNGDGIKGCVYFPKNKVEVGGNNFAAGEQLIAWRILIHGEGDIYINYDGRNAGVAHSRSALVR